MQPPRKPELRISSAMLRDQKDQILLEVSGLCRALRIRALAGGGGVFAAQGLIAPAVSSSVSFVVDPASFRHLVTSLREQGWVKRMPPRSLSPLPPAMTTLHHPDWAAGLVLHSVIPGFFGDPEETFDLLWERAADLAVRGTRVPSLDRVATAIFAVHDGLTGRGRSRASSNFAFFAQQFRVALTDDERAELSALVHQVGGLEEMRPLLQALDIKVGALVLPSDAYARWRLALDEVTDDVRWVLGFFELPPACRVEMIGSFWAGARSPRRSLRALGRLPATTRAILGARKRWTRAWA